MRLILRALMIIWPALILVYAYAGWKVYNALIGILPLQAKFIQIYMLATISYLNLYPVLLLTFRLFKFTGIEKSLTGGNRFWDIFFAYPFWLGLLLMAEILPWFLIIDFLKLPFYPFYDRFRETWIVLQNRVALSIVAVMAIYILIRVVIDTVTIKIIRIGLSYRSIPAGLNGLRIAHISDIHADNRTRKRKIQRYVKKLNRLKPDLTFFTGDLVSSGKKHINLSARILGAIRSKYGTYACLGDHDIWSGNKEIIQVLKENQIQVLQNNNEFIHIGRNNLLVTFITNTYSHRPNLDNLNFLMGQQPRGTLDVLITHQPSESIIEMAAERGYHLFLAGHTHGGQIVFRPFGLKLTPVKLETSFYKGVYFVEKMMVNINNGLGLTFVPIRFRAPAEITLIQITRN
jgi:predicted MPP superfamily phosphohydrolase